ncbi:tRNA (adenosine(37)-N6)-threonylcarbamoyltransferase complex ATPase subunit type 1 TsaE [Candidatus Saccharibacteria bacterium]|nr:tRNA (adenosine(37)-N6)-threonylcarbamoyltransferase complex ATPase subunit type 1 TsaE [Candidatus Saccharibacteria bacterium]
MKIASEEEMLAFGKNFAKDLKPPKIIELIGDVGAGKTTFVRGLAEGLGVKEPVTSPSFTISKEYAFDGGVLIHYDFYRISDPGLMAGDLEESIMDPQAITIVEWADSVENVLPEDRVKISIKYCDDGSREIEL